MIYPENLFYSFWQEIVSSWCVDNCIVDEMSKDTLEIPLEFGLRRCAGLDDWWFGPSVTAFYINFDQPWI